VNNFDEELIKKYVARDKWKTAINKLQSGYPVQYIIGNVEFFGNIIEVNESVLIPRFETEYLVEDLLSLIKQYHFNEPEIIDIGTGSGCIAISLKKNVKSTIDAVDISENAIRVARKNAKNNNVNINFITGDISNIILNRKYDIIVSNPPYVSYEIPVDDKTKYEPQNAIFAPDSGLYFYKVILEKSASIAKKRSIIAFEIGHNQASTIEQMAFNYYPNAKVIAKNDLNGFNRYIYIIND